MSPQPSRQGPDLPRVEIPARYNYIGAFLTLECDVGCDYCINRFGGEPASYEPMPAARWIAALNRIRTRPDLPVTLQGGEPTRHPDFLAILRGIGAVTPVDLLTNLGFDIDRFMAEIPPARFRREAPYASIRVSFHPDAMDAAATRDRVLRLLRRGYSVGVWMIDHPGRRDEVGAARRLFESAGIDFRVKEFLGTHAGRLHGTYGCPDALAGSPQGPVECRTSELIIAPDGRVFRCHADLYGGRTAIGDITDPDFRVEDVFRPCACFGLCNPCDVKIKTDRFQQHGHTSVEIRPARAPAPG